MGEEGIVSLLQFITMKIIIDTDKGKGTVEWKDPITLVDLELMDYMIEELLHKASRTMILLDLIQESKLIPND